MTTQEVALQPYRHTGFRSALNRLVTLSVKLRLPMGGSKGHTALLTVPGRKSGLPRTTPIALLPAPEGWYLMSPYGIVDWVRNLRAAGAATVTVQGTAISVTASELPHTEAAPILRETVAGAGRMLRKAFAPYFEVTPDAPLRDWEVEAEQHPVFQLVPDASGAAQSPSPQEPALKDQDPRDP